MNIIFTSKVKHLFHLQLNHVQWKQFKYVEQILVQTLKKYQCKANPLSLSRSHSVFLYSLFQPFAPPSLSYSFTHALPLCVLRSECTCKFNLCYRGGGGAPVHLRHLRSCQIQCSWEDVLSSVSVWYFMFEVCFECWCSQVIWNSELRLLITVWICSLFDGSVWMQRKKTLNLREDINEDFSYVRWEPCWWSWAAGYVIIELWTSCAGRGSTEMSHGHLFISSLPV